jgi:CheY-like chemotaxis protein
MTNKRILILAEEKFLRELIQGYLEEVGGEIQAVGSGAEGMSAILAQAPDLVILDRSLPDQTGLELCQKLKADFKTRSVPILMLRAGNQPGDEPKCREAGADEVVSKPIKPRQLLQKAAKLLGIPVRYAMGLPVTLSGGGGAGAVPFKGEILDLSETGCKVQTRLKLGLNTQLRIQLQLPGQMLMNLEAKIMRLESPGAGNLQVYGARFLNPDPQYQARIQTYLQSLPVKIHF